MNPFRKPTIEELWDRHRPEFLKIYSSEQVKPLTHGALTKVFIDPSGKQYYKFPKDVSLPIERFGKMKEYMTWMAMGISASEFDSLMNSMEKILEDGLGKRQNVVGLGAILQEIKKRRGMVVHSDLLYEFAAVQLIREDEHPEHFDADVQRDKIRVFKEMSAGEGSYFFFQKTELKSLSIWLNMSADEWAKYWEESKIQINLLPEALKVFASSTT
jgi:hypothetical protein